MQEQLKAKLMFDCMGLSIRGLTSSNMIWPLAKCRFLGFGMSKAKNINIKKYFQQHENSVCHHQCRYKWWVFASSSPTPDVVSPSARARVTCCCTPLPCCTLWAIYGFCAHIFMWILTGEHFRDYTQLYRNYLDGRRGSTGGLVAICGCCSGSILQLLFGS